MKQDHLYSASLPSQNLLQDHQKNQYVLKQQKTRMLPSYQKKIQLILQAVHRISSVAKSFIEEDRERHT